ncbi:MAG: beta-xylosidase, partial [Phycisphaerales bacterium]
MRNPCRLSVVVLSLMSPLAQAEVVSISVDATQRGEPLRHVWQYYGFDECNYTTTPDCVDLMKTVAEVNIRPTYLREHFLLNSGDGVAMLKWGSTNVYSEDKDGRP